MHNGPKRKTGRHKERHKKKKKRGRRKEAARPLKGGLVTGVDEPCVTST